MNQNEKINKVFGEYSRLWNLSAEAIRLIFLVIDLTEEYSRSARVLNEFGCKISSSQLRHFYKKIIVLR